ncbi:hypothetical protein C8R47DRAFT_640769 [Mycena vitilis]|nr:hypothetical protein C8R47DRAFT_640769 [Mycena vitilis]
MSQGFEGSVVLTQDSTGHCSISGPSICPVLRTRDAETQTLLSAEDRELLDVVQELATKFSVRFPGGLYSRRQTG